MHARDDAQMAKQCSIEYGATANSGATAPSGDANSTSNLGLSPTKMLGSSRECSIKCLHYF